MSRGCGGEAISTPGVHDARHSAERIEIAVAAGALRHEFHGAADIDNLLSIVRGVADEELVARVEDGASGSCLVAHPHAVRDDFPAGPLVERPRTELILIAAAARAHAHHRVLGSGRAAPQHHRQDAHGYRPAVRDESHVLPLSMDDRRGIALPRRDYSGLAAGPLGTEHRAGHRGPLSLTLDAKVTS